MIYKSVRKIIIGYFYAAEIFAQNVYAVVEYSPLVHFGRKPLGALARAATYKHAITRAAPVSHVGKNFFGFKVIARNHSAVKA